jgi:hypothetical protein
MTGDKAVELINEWLNLAKEVGDITMQWIEWVLFDKKSMIIMTT